MDAGSLSVPGVLENYARQLSGERLVGILLVISMSLQLVLIFVGAHRYHCSGAIFRFMVWGSYISADAVAIYALGTMSHSCARSSIYRIWAAVLLLHLGGPDALAAHSRADCELWWRHGFNMVSQVSLAMYVIYLSALKGYALASAILLLVAGATKYGERTLALWFASDSQIANKCVPISKYMKERNIVQDRGYVVMGEKQMHRIMKKELEKSMAEGTDVEEGSESDIEEWPSQEGGDNGKGLQAALLKGKGIVTVEDVKNAKIEGMDFNLCLSFAFFKMYLRRFVCLHFDEADWKETRALWVGFNGKDAFRIAERELIFMYDVLFSKGSGIAFSSVGIALRLLNSVLMGVAAFLILRESKEREVKQRVTSVVISVAVVVM